MNIFGFPSGFISAWAKIGLWGKILSSTFFLVVFGLILQKLAVPAALSLIIPVAPQPVLCILKAIDFNTGISAQLSVGAYVLVIGILRRVMVGA